MELKHKIIREEYFHYLVENGFDKSGMVLWVDFGHYCKVIMKSDYESNFIGTYVNPVAIWSALKLVERIQMK